MCPILNPYEGFTEMQWTVPIKQNKENPTQVLFFISVVLHSDATTPGFPIITLQRKGS